VTKIEFAKSEIELQIGATEKLSVKHEPAELATPAYEFSSSDKSIATVNEKGEVTGVSVGETKILVNAFGGTLNSSINIKVLPIKTESISFPKDSLTTIVDGNITLKPTILPENATNKEVIWSVENDTIVSINNGVVTGKKLGETSITALVKGTELKTSVRIFVKKQTIVFESDTLELLKGDAKTLTASVFPENSKNKELTWTIENDNIATIENGKITAKNYGKTKITAQIKNTDIKESIVVSVKKLELKINKSNISLVPTEYIQLVATLSPKVEGKKIVWSCSDNLSVEDGLVKCKSHSYQTYLRASVEGMDDVNVLCNVQTYNAKAFVSKRTVKIGPNETDSIYGYTSLSNVKRDFVWSSKDESIATVNNGVITAKKYGETYIYGTIKNSELKDSCLVKVQDVFELYKYYSMDIGESQSIVRKIYPKNSKVTWTSNDETVATIKDGVVTAKLDGYVTVYGTNEAKGLKDSCVITINPSIKFADTLIKAKKYEKIRLTPKITTRYPSYQGEKLEWESSNKDLVKYFTYDGGYYSKHTWAEFTPTKTGETTITIKVGSKIKSICKIVVEADPFTTFEFKDDEVDSKVGEKIRFPMNLIPTPGLNSNTPDYKLFSRDTSLIYKDYWDFIAKKSGSTFIIAEASDGSIDSVKVNITYPELESIDLGHNLPLLIKGTSYYLPRPSVTPTHAHIDTLRYTCEDNKYFSVNEKGVVTVKNYYGSHYGYGDYVKAIANNSIIDSINVKTIDFEEAIDTETKSGTWTIKKTGSSMGYYSREIKLVGQFTNESNKPIKIKSYTIEFMSKEDINITIQPGETKELNLYQHRSKNSSESYEVKLRANIEYNGVLKNKTYTFKYRY
jgi:uncharacterized protein YjdB